MWLFLAFAAGLAGWMHLQVTLPAVLKFTAKTPFEMPVGIDAVRGGGQAEDGVQQVLLDFAGQAYLPYEVTLVGFGTYDRISAPDPMGLTVLSYGSSYSTPVPAMITGRRNGLVYVVDHISLLP